MRERAGRRVLPMKVNPDLFFKFHDGKFIVWNYRAHEQYELTLPYLQRLYEIGTGSSPAIDAPQEQIDRELAGADLVSASYPTAHWGWDILSHIFHFGTNWPLPPDGVLPREDSSTVYIERCEAM